MHCTAEEAQFHIANWKNKGGGKGKPKPKTEGENKTTNVFRITCTEHGEDSDTGSALAVASKQTNCARRDRAVSWGMVDTTSLEEDGSLCQSSDFFGG